LTFEEILRNASPMPQIDIEANAWLIADIGATNARCAITGLGNSGLSQLAVYSNRDFQSLQHLLESYLSGLAQRPRQAALALAAPIVGETVEMVNCDWHFERQPFSRALEFERLELFNDYHATAFALPYFPAASLAEIGEANNYVDSNRAVLGPGSGLGMAAWIGNSDSGSVMTGEGGHITLAARNEQEAAIIRKIAERYGHCSAERVLSGPGIIDLHRTMHGIEVATSEEIASNQDNAECAATMQQFFRFLGSVSADLALISGSFGGVYIGGGIIPACLKQFVRSDFRQRFDDKCRYRDYMMSIPTYVITDPTPGLTGLSAWVNSRS
jgi:glucokinase